MLPLLLGHLFSLHSVNRVGGAVGEWAMGSPYHPVFLLLYYYFGFKTISMEALNIIIIGNIK